jgi:MFS transporter, DHA1 family, tetracycline resistance protein
LILTVYVVAQFLCTPLLGSLSDRYGRKPIIVASLLIEAAAFALTALAGSLVVLLIARFIVGIGSSNIGSAQAVVADVTPPQERARGMGLIGAAIGMGFVVGPALGGVLAKWGEVVPFSAALGVALVSALLVVQFLPETHKRPGVAEPAPVVQRRHSGPFGGWQRTLRSPAISCVIAINLLFTLAFTAMEAVFPLFSQRLYGWNAIENGYVFTYAGIPIVVIQGGLVGRLVKCFGEHTILISGLALLAVGLLLLPVSRSLVLLLAAITPTAEKWLAEVAAADWPRAQQALPYAVAAAARLQALERDNNVPSDPLARSGAPAHRFGPVGRMARLTALGSERRRADCSDH